MKTLILLLFLSLFHVQPKNIGCLEMDIMVLCDLSGSVEGNEPFILEAVVGLINKTDVQEDGIRIGVMGFSNTPFTIAAISGNKKELLKTINEFDWSSRDNTYMAQALQVSYIDLLKDRQYVNKMIIIISDGLPSDRGETLSTIKQLNDINVGICGVLIKDQDSDASFMMAISGACYVETSWENLATELAKMDVCL